MISRRLIVGALVLAACTEPRQLVLSIGTTAGVPCDIDSLRVVTNGTTAFEQRLKGTRFPVDITLLDDTPTGAFDVEIAGFRGSVEVMRIRGEMQFRGRKAIEHVLLEAKCTPDTPCELTAAMAAGAEAPRSAGHTCADVSRYSAVPALDGTLVDVCMAPDSRRALQGKIDGPVRLEDLEADLADPNASFQFYGRPVRQVWVAKDGYISFSETDPDPHDNLVPGAFDSTPPPPRQSVMAFWDSLSLDSEGVCYLLSGSKGSRLLRVQWLRSCLTARCAPPDQDNLNFSITLEETSQRIVVAYGDARTGDMRAQNAEAARGLNATVGLVNDPTGCAVDDCALDTGLCKTDNTPCGYSQFFSKKVFTKDAYPGGIPSMQFSPIVDPD